MQIGGIIDISTKDIPNRASMVFFTAGCNFNCSFCHNKKLLHKNAGRNYKIDEVISLIKNNVLINSISITGGEPTLQKDLLDLCEELQNLQIYTSIDTNGTNPKMLKKMLPHVDRVALDIKSPLTKEMLRKVTNSNIDPRTIIESFGVVNQADNVDFEVRTTYVENLLRSEDLDEIMKFLMRNNFRGDYVLQQYQYSEGIGEEFMNKFKKPEHEFLLDILRPYQDLYLDFNLFLRDDLIGYSEIGP
ncbi:MAG: anaerobic ribonucleoside-triphosphate reductase activating protein [Promethearchaeota archaeon]|nr:MAG: anaerobic ribonucleoside-triphosphate reductase activating protein [Candidatus Lokiarchaeota archaeon]